MLQTLLDAEEETLAKIQNEKNDRVEIDLLDVFGEKFKDVDAEIVEILTKCGFSDAADAREERRGFLPDDPLPDASNAQL